MERAARLLYMAHAAEASSTAPPTAASIFRAVGEHGHISEDKAEGLAEAATLWRSYRGAERVVAGDGGAAETSDPRVGAVVARACGMDDVDALNAAVHRTAARAAADIDALTA